MLRRLAIKVSFVVIAVLGLTIGSGLGQEAMAWKSGAGYICSGTTSCGPGQWFCEVECMPGTGVCMCSTSDYP